MSAVKLKAADYRPYSCTHTLPSNEEYASKRALSFSAQYTVLATATCPTELKLQGVGWCEARRFEEV